jgi:hypothetical protein
MTNAAEGDEIRTEAILPEDLVLRRIPPQWVVRDGDHFKASSQAFNNDGDGEPMSIYLDELLRLNRLERQRVIDGHDGFFVAALKVEDLQREDQEVIHDPIEPPIHCCDPAHGIAVGGKAPKVRKRLARSARWLPGLGPGPGEYLDEA